MASTVQYIPTRFSYTPQSPTQSLPIQPTRNSLSKWNALSLPLLSPLPITSLVLVRLSQCGAQALSTLLSSLSDCSFLEDLMIDFVWLDDSLCEAIVDAGRRIRQLKVGTTGTKLTDMALVERIREMRVSGGFHTRGSSR